MPYRRKLITLSAAVVLAFSTYGNAQADEHLAKVRTEVDVTRGADVSSDDNTEITITADDIYEHAGVIEEIIVFGKSNRRNRSVNGSSASGLVLETPTRVEWQFFPKYDPAQTDRDIYLADFSAGTQSVGFIEVIRFGFGWTR